MSRVQQLHLQNYKGFENFTIVFGDFAVLVGPNNAGKSTIIDALRGASKMLRIAGRRRGTLRVTDRSGLFEAHPITASIGLDAANLRHEFRDRETRLELRMAGNHVLRAVWPVEDEGPAYFYVAGKGDTRLSSLATIRTNMPPPYVVDTLSPIEPREGLLSDDYVLKHRTGRLSPRHFRNNLRLLDESVQHDDTTRL